MSPLDLAKRMVMRIGTKYASQSVSQPFEVAITNLQCRYVPKRTGKKKGGNGIFGNANGRAQGGKEDDVR